MAGATKGGAGQAQSGQPPDGTGEAGTLNARTVRVGTAAGLMPAYAARPDAHATAAVIVGFCMGGSIALFAAVAYPLGAAVTFYGGGVAEGRFGFPSLIELASGLTTPWLGLYGDKDQGIPSDQVEALRTAAGRSGVPSEIVRYPDAGHGFHCDARPAAYSPVAARDAWARAVSWLRLHLPEP